MGIIDADGFWAEKAEKEGREKEGNFEDCERLGRRELYVTDSTTLHRDPAPLKERERFAQNVVAY